MTSTYMLHLYVSFTLKTWVYCINTIISLLKLQYVGATCVYIKGCGSEPTSILNGSGSVTDLILLSKISNFNSSE